MQTVKTIRNAAILAVAAMSVSAPAALAASPEIVEVNVSFDARDLNSENGVERIYRKLQKKAERSCSTISKKTLSNLAASQQCSANLLNDFVADANNAKLIGLHKSVAG